jgi:demethylmenaquinone methyltransferase/2-methoxy-6-polyprenyl-1,4-benzoquinol methylase
MFDAISPRYDFLNRFLSAGFDRRWRAAAVRALTLTGREHVIDLCTGTADLAIAATAATGGAARVTGVDFAEGMLQIGLRKTRARGLDQCIALVRGDATAVPLAGGSADAAMIAFGIRNVDAPERAVAELVRVLRPAGRLAILEFGVPHIVGLRELYLWYFRRVLPVMGGLVSRYRDAYTYLPESVGAFPEPGEFAALLARAGFTDISVRPLSFGIVHLYLATRPA